MSNFRRALGVTLSLTLLALIGAAAFGLIYSVVENSGFSSGELLHVETENAVLSAEIMGQRFFFDFSPVLAAAEKYQIATLLLPPGVQLLLRFAVGLF